MARIPRSRRPATRRIRLSSFPSIPSIRWPRTKSATHQSHHVSISHKNHHHSDYKDATCSVCMDSPHNAVLLLCSSHEKGCRPYMCATSFRHSNCLDQFKKAYSKAAGSAWTESTENNKIESSDLTCPLCRGQVKGWTIVEPAREFLNLKKRNCMQDGCNFVGTYKELRKHVKCEHPSAKPREVDPTVEQKWRTLEHERERQDVMSTIRASMPRGVVFGDYVIEMGDSDDSDNDNDVARDVSGEGYDDVAGDDGARGGVNRSILYFFLREGSRFMRGGQGDEVNRHTFFDDDDEDDEGEGEDDDVAGEGRGAGPFGLERRRRRRSRVRFV